ESSLFLTINNFQTLSHYNFLKFYTFARMKFTVQQIADLLEGEIVGNSQAEVFQLSKIEEGSDGALTFLANPKYEHHIYTTKATATIVSIAFVPESKIFTTLIKVEDAYKAFSKL